MNFQNVNLLNSRINLLSGNLLPMTVDSQFPMIWRVHGIIVWVLELIHTIALIFGLILVPGEKALQDGTVCVAVILEASFMLTRLYMREKLMSRVIQKMNDLMSSADEIMSDIVKSALKPITIPFTVYGIISAMTIILWTVQPIILAFEKSKFFYVDYNLPAAFSAEPFSVYVLIPSTVIMTIGSVYLFLKKYGVDIYMMHLVRLLTAQYRYMATKLTMLFQIEHHPGTDRWVEEELRALCRHQNTVLSISFMLKKLLSVNFSLLYLNSVFRFCFISIMMSSIPLMTLSEGISVLFFALGSITQFFLLCSSVQTLSDASTEITDKAFDEGWYQFGSSIRRTFVLLIMANNLECRIATVEKFNLSLPSFMTIMNQSYSIALLFLRAK